MRVRWDAKAVLVAILSVTVVCASGQSQNDASKSAPPPATPVFKAKTDLVLIPVSVRDKSGKHVGGLTQDAFTVRQDGKEQKVAVFEEISTAAKPATRPKLPPNAFTNTIADSQQRRVIIIALDTVNTAFADQAYAREQLIKYLSEQVDPDALLCLVTINRGGVKLIHDFTTDSRLLVAALHKVRGRAGVAEQTATDPLINELQNDLVFQNEVDALKSFTEARSEIARGEWRMQVLVTLDALNELSQAFAGVPGKKSLLWATGGFPFQFTDPNEAQNRPQFAEILPEYEHTWRLLNNANIAVYPIDVRGLVNPTVPPPSIRLTARDARSFVDTSVNQHMQTIQGMQMVAEMTGGRAFYNSNDITRGFRRAGEDSESYYLLGYYRDTKDDKPGWRKLKIEAHVEHAEVHSRSGFYVGKAAKSPDDVRKQDIRLALASPLEYTSVPMAVQWLSHAEPNAVPDTHSKSSDKKDDADKKQVLFQLLLASNSMEIDADDSNHMKFEVLGLVTDHEGKRVAEIGQTIEAHLKPDGLKQMTESGLTYKNAFHVPPGDYTARIMVRDALSGHIGTIIAPLKVQ